MPDELVRHESAGRVATITMNRLDRKNALNDALVGAIRQAWFRFRNSEDRVAILASADPEYFCVGVESTRFYYPEAKLGVTQGGISSIAARLPHNFKGR